MKITRRSFLASAAIGAAALVVPRKAEATNTWELVGDSITNNWFVVASQHHSGALNGGTPGDTTWDINCRYAAVLANAPYGVAIMAGINDIVNGPGGVHSPCVATPSGVTAADIFARLQIMYDTSLAAGQRVVACSVLPVTSTYYTGGRAQKILDLNVLIQAYVSTHCRMKYCDFHTALVGGDGHMTAGLSGDGLHPNSSGYDIMYPIQEAAITAASNPMLFPVPNSQQFK